MASTQTLGDGLAIREVLARIARLADVGSPEDYLDHFTDDATWELASAEGLPLTPTIITGRQALLEGVLERRRLGLQGPGTFTAHAVSTTSVDVRGGEASAHSLFMYYTGMNGTPTLAAIGRYEDTFVRSETGEWLLRYRKITRE